MTTIGSEPPLEMSGLFKKANIAIDSSQVALKNVTVATANLSSISSKINAGQGQLSAINDKKIYTQLDQTTAGLRDTVSKAQTGVSDFQENMEALKSFPLRGYFKIVVMTTHPTWLKQIAKTSTGIENIHIH